MRSDWHYPGEHHDITDYDDPSNILFTRWFVIGTPFGAVMVHKLRKSDVPNRDVPNRGVHDHPWNFVSFAFGKYWELREFPGERHRFAEPPHFFRFRRATDLHRVALCQENKPVWTLVIHGRRQREWGFYQHYVWKPWYALKEESGDSPDYHNRRARSLKGA